jgi:ethanolamine utilization protein EutA (predicted chaperonin)
LRKSPSMPAPSDHIEGLVHTCLLHLDKRPSAVRSRGGRRDCIGHQAAAPHLLDNLQSPLENR